MVFWSIYPIIQALLAEKLLSPLLNCFDVLANVIWMYLCKPTSGLISVFFSIACYVYVSANITQS